MIDQETLKTFDELYNATYPKVLKYVICNCSNAEDVKDIIQNIYLELLKKLQNGITINQTSAYILGIAKNKIKEYYRYNYKAKIISIFSKKEEINLLDTIPSEIDLQEDTIKKEDLKFIFNYLKKKKVIIFQVFYLYYYEGISIKEISKELNISESNVKHYLYRTIKELYSIMKNGDETDV